MRHSDGLTLMSTSTLASLGVLLGISINVNLVSMWHNWVIVGLGPGIMMNVMLLAGCLLTVPACYLAAVVARQPPLHRPCPLPMLAGLVCVLSTTMLMLSLGLGAMSTLSQQLRETKELRAAMQGTMENTNMSPIAEAAFSQMQWDLKCCGVDSPEEWFAITGKEEILPPSCCHHNLIHNETFPCVVSRAGAGCLHPAIMSLRCYACGVAGATAVMLLLAATSLTSNSYSLIWEVTTRANQRIKASAMSRFSDRYSDPITRIPEPSTSAVSAPFSARSQPFIPFPTLSNPNLDILDVNSILQRRF